MKKCRECKKPLTNKNWSAWRKKRRSLVCTTCSRIHYRELHIKNREARNERQRQYRLSLRKEVLMAYGGKCACCGENELKFLTIEHTKNDGAKHRKKIGGSSRLYNWLKKNGFPKEGFEVLCFNCNNARFFYGECPHKKGAQE